MTTAAGPSATDHGEWYAETFNATVRALESEVFGNRRQLALTLAAATSGLHVLVEDVPGSGKSRLVRAFACAVDGRRRVVPGALLDESDLVSTALVPNDGGAEVEPPHVLVVEEVDQASARARAVLLTLMDGNRVSTSGAPRQDPFVLLATHTRRRSALDLDESLLDRFAVRIQMATPDHEAMIEILDRPHGSPRDPVPVITHEVLRGMAQLAGTVFVDPAILGYVSRLAQESGRLSELSRGLTIRSCLDLVSCSRAWALAQGRPHVTPDDIRDVAEPVLAHRLHRTLDAVVAGASVESLVNRILASVAPPRVSARVR